MATTFNVNTNAYRFAHGKRPRGDGYWVFTVSCTMGVQQVWPYHGEYSLAVLSAKRQARKLFPGCDSFTLKVEN